MTHINMATGMDTFAYSNWFKNDGMDGMNFPINTPTTMQIATQTVKYF